jgi:hypothetical protein
MLHAKTPNPIRAARRALPDVAHLIGKRMSGSELHYKIGRYLLDIVGDDAQETVALIP